jgi:uncharacterized protein YjiS (DUF1127 family)
MREYVLNRAILQEQAGPLAWWRQLWRNWQAKRSVATLINLNDHLLRDVELTRADVEWALSLPLSVNAMQALEERAFRRRRPMPK